MSWKVIKPIPFNPFKINGVEYKNSLELAMRIEELEKENAEMKSKEKQIEKVKYTLKKIIETVHNDRIDYYGERLVLIYDFANECLEEIEK